MAGNATPTGGLLKVLGVAFGLAVLVGNTIGMGILRTPGEVAAHLPSVPFFLSAWAIGAAYAILGALCVSELAAMRPSSGGLFPLVSHGMGPYFGFVVGWTDMLSTAASTAAVAMVLGEYTGPLIPGLAGHATLTASAVIVAFAVLQWRGIRVSDTAQQLTSALKAIALVALAAVALLADESRITAAIAIATPARASVSAGIITVGAVILALQSVIYTYDGWTGPVYFGEEIQDPGRNIPRTMILGVLVVMGIYLLLNAAFLRVVPIADMAGDPFVAASAAMRLFGVKGDTVLRLVMILSMLASVNALMLMVSRIPYGLSRAGWLPAWFGRVNVGGTPVSSHFTCTLLTLLIVATDSFSRILALLAFLFVSNYALTFTSLFMARRREPNVERPFRVPWYPLVPAVALTGSVAFMVAALVSDRANSLGALALVALSWPVYRALRRRERVQLRNE